MSGSVLGATIVLVVLTVCAMATTIVALVLRYCCGRGMVLPGNLALLVPGRSGDSHTTTWEPLIIDAGTHDHDDAYATPGNITDALADHVANQHGPHDHDERYSRTGHGHEQYVTHNALNLRLAALRISQIPQNLRGALGIIVVGSLIGALIGLVLDVTALRNMYRHQELSSVTGKVIGSTVNLTPHYHTVVDLTQALGYITMFAMAGGLIGAIIVLLTWWHRNRQAEVVSNEN